MICLSHRSTTELVDMIAQEWDKEVRLWSEHWKELSQVGFYVGIIVIESITFIVYVRIQILLVLCLKLSWK